MIEQRWWSSQSESNTYVSVLAFDHENVEKTLKEQKRIFAKYFNPHVGHQPTSESSSNQLWDIKRILNALSGLLKVIESVIFHSDIEIGIVLEPWIQLFRG